MNSTLKRRRPSHLAVVGESTPQVTSTGFPLNTIGCFSGNGSPGRSTLAVNIATELALSGQRVLLLDLDTLSPSLVLGLGLLETPAGLSASLRLAEQGRLSRSEFERLTVTISLGRQELLFMPGLSSPSRWSELNIDRLEALIQAVTGQIDHIVMDLPAPSFTEGSFTHPSTNLGLTRDEFLKKLLPKLTKLVVISGCDPVAARRFIEAQEFLSAVGAKQDQLVVVNRFRTKALGANAKAELEQSYERLVGLRIDSYIPDDPENIDSAMRNGLPLALLKRSSPARQAISELTRQILISSSKSLRRG